VHRKHSTPEVVTRYVQQHNTVAAEMKERMSCKGTRCNQLNNNPREMSFEKGGKGMTLAFRPPPSQKDPPGPLLAAWRQRHFGSAAHFSWWRVPVVEKKRPPKEARRSSSDIGG
jgi:hypothetical protein